MSEVKVSVRADDMLTITLCQKSLVLRICGESMCSSSKIKPPLVVVGDISDRVQ